MRLFACIHVPDFPVQAAMRLEAASCNDKAIAILDGPDSLQKVYACNIVAQHAGIFIGMNKNEAAVLATVALRRRRVADEEAAHSALMDCGFSFSPRLESTRPGTIIIDLTGSNRLLGSAGRIARQLQQRASQCNLKVNVALASNPDSALHAARGLIGITVIAPGEERLRLSPLPIEVLQPDGEILETLDSWGIRDLKSLSEMPKLALTQRLGQHGLRLQLLARGEVARELIPAEPMARFYESVELEEPITLLEPLAFVFNCLLEQLTTRLLGRALAADQIYLDLGLEVHPDRQVRRHLSDTAAEPWHRRVLKLPVPTQDTKIFLRLLQLDLAAHPPQAPVRKVKIDCFNLERLSRRNWKSPWRGFAPPWEKQTTADLAAWDFRR
jgi:protein ImuB